MAIKEPKNRANFLARHSAAITRLKADFFEQYTSTGSVAKAIDLCKTTYHVYRYTQQFDEDFYDIVQAANNFLDDNDEAFLRDVAHGRIGNVAAVRVTAVMCLLNNRRYNRPDTQISAPPQIVRNQLPRPEPSKQEE